MHLLGCSETVAARQIFRLACFCCTFPSEFSNLVPTDAPAERYVKRLLVPDGVHEAVISVGDIDWIEAADYDSCLHVGFRTYMLHQTTKQLREKAATDGTGTTYWCVPQRERTRSQPKPKDSRRAASMRRASGASINHHTHTNTKALVSIMPHFDGGRPCVYAVLPSCDRIGFRCPFNSSAQCGRR